MLYRNEPNNKKDIIVGIGILIVISFLLFFVNPFNVSIIVVLLLPMLVAILIVKIFKVVISNFFIPNNNAKLLSYSRVIFFIVLIVFMLGSLKQLQFTDMVLILLFAFGIKFYLSKQSISHSSE